MASIDKRVEDLERRSRGGESVRINVVREGDEEPAYSVLLTPSGKFVRVEADEVREGSG